MNPSVTEKSGPALKSVTVRLAAELAVGERQVDAAVRLLDEGSTVPFIARYRKEVTGSLDDGQLRTLEERLGRRTPSRCSPETSRTCCSPPRRATAPRWAWIPDSGPA